MKIISLVEFLKMPEGTVYSKYSPCYFEGLMLKSENAYRMNFFYASLIGIIDNCDTGDFVDKCTLAEKSGLSLNLDFETIDIDHEFNKDQLFAIYEKKDLIELINVLNKSLEIAK